MALKQQILKKLPKTFNRQYVLKMFSERGYSVTYADSTLESLTHSGDIQRIGRGKYKNSTKN